MKKIFYIALILYSNGILAELLNFNEWNDFKKNEQSIELEKILKPSKEEQTPSYCNEVKFNTKHTSDPCCINPNLPVCGDL